VDQQDPGELSFLKDFVDNNVRLLPVVGDAIKEPGYKSLRECRIT
jgi:hypothetical protein